MDARAEGPSRSDVPPRDPPRGDQRGRLNAVANVELEARPGIEQQFVWFYGEFVGLRIVDPSETIDGVPVLRFKSDRVELRIRFVAEPRIESIDHRVNLGVPSLEAAAMVLEERKHPFDWMHGIAATDRALSLLDPGGNRVMIRVLRPWHTF